MDGNRSVGISPREANRPGLAEQCSAIRIAVLLLEEAGEIRPPARLFFKNCMSAIQVANALSQSFQTGS